MRVTYQSCAAVALWLAFECALSVPLEQDRDFSQSTESDALERRVTEDDKDKELFPLDVGDDGLEAQGGKIALDVPKTYKEFTAIGDSYSAGPGIPWTNRDTAQYAGKSADGKDCLRTSGGWPRQLMESLGLQQSSFQFSACTGLTTEQIRKEQVEAEGSKFGKPDLVTITTGGNDDNSFAKVVLTCPLWIGRVKGGASSCTEAIKTATATVEGTKIVDDMNKLLDAVVDRVADDATIVVLGYPALYNQDTASPGLTGNCLLSPDRRTEINGLVNKLNLDLIRDKVIGKYPKDRNGKKYRILFADTNAPPKDNDPSFNGHRFCEATARAYFQGTTAKDPRDLVGYGTFYKGMFHPNFSGMKVMATAALRTLQNDDKNVHEGQANGNEQSEADFDRRPVCAKPEVGADKATALKDLTVDIDSIIDLGPPGEGDPIDPMDEIKEKRDSSTEALSSSFSDLELSNRRLGKRDDVPVPSSVWWKFQYGKGLRSDGYVTEGNKPTDAWTLGFKAGETSITPISELSITLVPKTDIPKVERSNGVKANGWQADHILEGQVMSNFFSPTENKQNYQAGFNQLLKKLTETYLHKNDVDEKKYGQFLQYGNCEMEEVAMLINGDGNIAPLVAALNGYKGGLFYGNYKTLDPKNDHKIAGVLLYMYQVTEMHHGTVDAIGRVFDRVPDAGGKYGADFACYAKTIWGDMIKMLEDQYNEIKNNKPLLADKPPTVKPSKGSNKRKSPDQGGSCSKKPAGG